MDLLGDLREEAGDQKAACRKGVLGTERRHAQTLLLARMPSPIKSPETRRAQSPGRRNSQFRDPRSAFCAVGEFADSFAEGLVEIVNLGAM